jgi:hypothetical protein
MPAYGIAVTEDYIDLVQFLNDGIRPPIEEETTFLIFEVNGPREITSKIVSKEELYGKSVHELLFLS